MGAPEMPEPRSKFYESQRIKMHYSVWGDGEKPPMLLVHGGRDHSRNWDFVAAHLVDQYTIYAPDLRGHGDSGWAIGGMYSFPEFTLDVATLASKLPLPLTIFGHSLGGAVAMQYAGVFPENVEKVISIEGWGPPDMPHVSAQVRMRQWIGHMHNMEERSPKRYKTIEDATERMIEANPHLTPEMARHLTIHGSNTNDDGTFSWKFDNYVRIMSPMEFNMEDARDIWSRIDCPILLVKGSESWAPDPEKVGRTASMKNCRTVVIDDAGHWVHHDQLDRTMDEVLTFLAE